jgi:hypothetical protein
MTYFPIWILFSKHFANVKKTNNKIKNDNKNTIVKNTNINKFKVMPFF